MKDIFKKYKKHKLLSNIWVVAASLVLAFGINVFLIDGTQVGQNLKANVLQPISQEESADIFVIKQWSSFVLKSSKNINNPVNLSLSLIYNWENINISELTSQFWDIVTLQNEPWINSMIVNMKTWTNVKANEDIIKFLAEKQDETKVENINVINANFKDNTNELYFLSTSWTTF
jgi:hypothetical protein